MNKHPIGVFDSGYGGLTVLKEMCALMPKYDFIYLGDNARAPYGSLSFETVYHYTLECVEWFFKQGCPLVILACNTASAKALRSIQQNDLPKMDSKKRVLGVIRPTAEVMNNFTSSNHIGVMGTKGTIDSKSYLIEINKFYPHIKVTQEACTEWVSLVEENKIDSPEADFFVKEHIENLLQKDVNIDSILLACTHYPLLINKIKQFLPSHISLISQGEIVADSLVKYLEIHKEIDEVCLKTGSKQFFTTGDVINFNEHASQFFGEQITASKIIL